MQAGDQVFQKNNHSRAGVVDKISEGVIHIRLADDTMWVGLAKHFTTEPGDGPTSRQQMIAKDFDIVTTTLKQARMQIERLLNDEEIRAHVRGTVDLADEYIVAAMVEIKQAQADTLGRPVEVSNV